MLLLIASNNPHKVEEMRSILHHLLPTVRVVGASDLSLTVTVEESGSTLEENAYLKALAFHRATSLPVLADDTGLEVEALGGAPGVYSARYAGHPPNAAKNRAKLLAALQNVPELQRRAQFRTVLCYMDIYRTVFAEGICTGRILTAERGDQGFGYDPLFLPDGYDRSFAELSMAEKNQISHRRRALEAFAQRYRALFESPQ